MLAVSGVRLAPLLLRDNPGFRTNSYFTVCLVFEVTIFDINETFDPSFNGAPYTLAPLHFSFWRRTR